MTAAQRQELEAVFRYCVRVPEGTPLEGISRAGWSGWDSMAQVTLVGAIEDQFDLPMAIEDAMAMGDWDSCVRVVAGKLSASG